MDPRQAQEELTAARLASAAGAIPRLGRWVSLEVGVLVGASITLAGRASSGAWWHLAELTAAVLLALAAIAVLHRARSRADLRGLQGSAREEWTATVVAGLALLVVAVGASSQERPIYAGLGVVTGLLTAWYLHRRDA